MNRLILGIRGKHCLVAVLFVAGRVNIGDGGACIACHDPHKELVAETAAYDSKCMACHAVKGVAPAANSQTSAKACPVQKSDCASSHMPAVKLAAGTTTFHDHLIRIVKPGTPYPD